MCPRNLEKSQGSHYHTFTMSCWMWNPWACTTTFSPHCHEEQMMMMSSYYCTFVHKMQLIGCRNPAYTTQFVNFLTVAVALFTCPKCRVAYWMMMFNYYSTCIYLNSEVWKSHKLTKVCGRLNHWKLQGVTLSSILGKENQCFKFNSLDHWSSAMTGTWFRCWAAFSQTHPT